MVSAWWLVKGGISTPGPEILGAIDAPNLSWNQLYDIAAVRRGHLQGRYGVRSLVSQG